MPLPCSAAMLLSAGRSCQFDETEQPADAVGRYVPRAVPESLTGPPEPGSRDVNLQRHDGFDTPPVPLDDVQRGPTGLLLRREPDGLEPALRLRAEQPVPLDAQQIAE